MSKPLVAPRRGRGLPDRRHRQMRPRNGAYRRWTWRSLLRAPIPQIVVGAMLLCTLYAVATSSLFSVTTVQAVDQPNLQSLLQQKCGCIGANIFLARTDDIRARLARIPWIDVHNVYAHLPNRIMIEASYRPVAALWRTDATVYAVDDNGQVLYDLQAPPPEVTEVPTTATVPLIYGYHNGALPIGAADSGQRGRRTAISMVREARANLDPAIAPMVDRYRWSESSGLSGHSKQLGYWFLLGFNTDNDDLVHRLAALVVANREGIMHNGHCNFVDLRIVVYHPPEASRAYCGYDRGWYGPWGPR